MWEGTAGRGREGENGAWGDSDETELDAVTGHWVIGGRTMKGDRTGDGRRLPGSISSISLNYRLQNLISTPQDLTHSTLRRALGKIK